MSAIITVKTTVCLENNSVDNGKHCCHMQWTVLTQYFTLANRWNVVHHMWTALSRCPKMELLTVSFWPAVASVRTVVNATSKTSPPPPPPPPTWHWIILKDAGGRWVFRKGDLKELFRSTMSDSHLANVKLGWVHNRGGLLTSPNLQNGCMMLLKVCYKVCRNSKRAAPL